MLKAQVFAQLIKEGWSRDSYGHLQKQRKGLIKGIETITKYRVKFQDTSIRIEKQLDVLGKNEWVRIGGGYYKDAYVENEILKFKK